MAKKTVKIKSKELMEQDKNNLLSVSTSVKLARRNNENMTQENLSDESGVNLSTIIKIESGKQMPSCDKLKRIADATHVTSDSLMVGMTFIYSN